MEEGAAPRVREPKLTINLHPCCKQPLRGCHRGTAESEAARNPCWQKHLPARPAEGLSLAESITSPAEEPRLGSRCLRSSPALLAAPQPGTTSSPASWDGSGCATPSLWPPRTSTLVFGRTTYTLGGFLFKSHPKELKQTISVLHPCGIQGD